MPLCDIVHSHCLSPAFHAAQVHHISLTITILPPLPLPAPYSAQIQKNSFHYHSLAKGHICQCGVASVSTDAFSSRTHPLAILCVPLSARLALPSPPPLWLFNSCHYLSLSPELHALPTPTSNPDAVLLKSSLPSTHFELGPQRPPEKWVVC